MIFLTDFSTASLSTNVLINYQIVMVVLLECGDSRDIFIMNFNLGQVVLETVMANKVQSET